MSNSHNNLWNEIQQAESENNTQNLQLLFQSITAEKLNQFDVLDTRYMLLHKLIKFFDLQNKYPQFLDNLFNLPNVDPEKVNINSKNPRNGTTALIHAASRGHLRLVQTLLFWKANPHSRSDNQMTPFYCACNHRHVEVAEYLSRYVTKEELQLKQTNTGNTVKENMEKDLMANPNHPKLEQLLKLIEDIELRHLVEERK